MHILYNKEVFKRRIKLVKLVNWLTELQNCLTIIIISYLEIQYNIEYKYKKFQTAKLKFFF